MVLVSKTIIIQKIINGFIYYIKQYTIYKRLKNIVLSEFIWAIGFLHTCLHDRRQHTVNVTLLKEKNEKIAIFYLYNAYFALPKGKTNQDYCPQSCYFVPSNERKLFISTRKFLH